MGKIKIDWTKLRDVAKTLKKKYEETHKLKGVKLIGITLMFTNEDEDVLIKHVLETDVNLNYDEYKEVFYRYDKITRHKSLVEKFIEDKHDYTIIKID